MGGGGRVESNKKRDGWRGRKKVPEGREERITHTDKQVKTSLDLLLYMVANTCVYEMNANDVHFKSLTTNRILC